MWFTKPCGEFKVTSIPLEDRVSAGLPEDHLTDFIDHRDDKAPGRSVDFAVSSTGDLQITAKVGNMIRRYRLRVTSKCYMNKPVTKGKCG